MKRFLKIAALILLALAAVGFALGYTPDTDPSVMRAKYAGQSSRFVALPGGQTVHLRDTGPRDGAVLMLVHGSNDSLFAWDAWVARLGQRYRIIQFDLPGHGLSGASPTSQYSTAAYALIVHGVK